MPLYLINAQSKHFEIDEILNKKPQQIRCITNLKGQLHSYFITAKLILNGQYMPRNQLARLVAP